MLSLLLHFASSEEQKLCKKSVINTQVDLIIYTICSIP